MMREFLFTESLNERRCTVSGQPKRHVRPLFPPDDASAVDPRI